METVENVARNIAELSIAGTNVTADVSPYISRLSFTDNVDAESDDISISLDDTSGIWREDWFPTQGDTLVAKIGQPGKMLDCGLFEIDQVDLEGPPDVFTIKAIGAAISKELRTKNTKGFEKQTLKKIAQYFADKHGLKLTGDVGKLGSISIDRKTQENQTDIFFLAGLAKEYGLLFSVRGEQLVFMNEEELEARPAVVTLTKEDMTRFAFSDKTSGVYASVVVASRNIKTNSVQRWNIQPSGSTASKDVLVQYVRVENESQAEAKAKAALRDKNKDKTTCAISMPGNIEIMAGVCIEIVCMGQFSGKWYITSSTHNVTREDGHTTDIVGRKTDKRT